MSKRIVSFLGLVLLIVIGLVAYRLYSNSENDKTTSGTTGRGKATVYGQIVTGREFSDYLSLTGTIEPNEVVELRAEVSGLIEEINFQEGTHVNAGQVLLRINDKELQAQLAQAETKNALAKENERRAKLLLEKEAISQEEYDVASADYRTTDSQVQLIKAQIDKTVLRAPFAGMIGLRKISKGGYITPTSDIAQLVNTSQLKVDFSVPEKYATKVKKGRPVSISVQNDTVLHAAYVYAIEPILEASTRTLRVRAMIDNSKENLIPGLFVNIVFPMDQLEDAILIPAEALIPVQNGKTVFVMKDGKAREILVESGARTNDDVLITKGLFIGDTVLTSGVMSLREGSSVNVTLR
jgi:membrane fusion protein (multidrug efflux system)